MLPAFVNDDGDGDASAGDNVVVLMISFCTAHLTEILPFLLRPQILGYFDIAFTSVFTVEIVLKVSEGCGTGILHVGLAGSGRGREPPQCGSNIAKLSSLGGWASTAEPGEQVSRFLQGRLKTGSTVAQGSPP